MTRRRETLRLGSHWHVDCRLEAELPDDKIVGVHFIANALFGTMTLGLLLFASYLGYKCYNIKSQIKAWDQSLAENAAEVRSIQLLQREYVTEASKVDQAYGSIRPALHVSSFVTALGRTLPGEVTIDMVEWNDSGILVRGYLREPVPVAARLLGDYIEVLRKDEKIGPQFSEIKVTAFDRAKRNEELQSFGLRFVLKPLPPL